MVVVPLWLSHTEENMINIRSICHTLPRNNFGNRNAQIVPQVQLRSFMAYLNAIFNSVDEGKVLIVSIFILEVNLENFYTDMNI